MAEAFSTSGNDSGHPATLSSTTKAVVARGVTNAISELSGKTIFGLTWTLADTSDGASGDQDFTVSASQTAEGSGTWSVSSFNSHSNVMLVMECSGGQEAACFLVNQAGGLSGTWSLVNWTGHPFRRISAWYNG
jgi:hypothetical protein